MSVIHRQCQSFQSLALKTDSTSPPIDFEDFSGGQIHIPSGSSITTLTWFTAPAAVDAVSAETKPGTFVAAQDSAGAAVTQTVSAAKSYPLPTVLFGAAYLQCRVNTNGSVDLTLKA